MMMLMLMLMDGERNSFVRGLGQFR